jgi:CPA1 family monovalent cation:H+ antiporter
MIGDKGLALSSLDVLSFRQRAVPGLSTPHHLQEIMETFEWTIILLLGAGLLSGLARRLFIPYPALLALGGAALAFMPFHPEWSLDPRLALTLFVAPVLMDAAYDASPRDLVRNWRTLVGLALFAVMVTTACVAVLLKWLVPEMSWPVAIMAGAIVAPPDAAAATAVMRRLPMPHRLRMVLEGESLINDASALLIYRFALVAAVSGGMTTAEFLPQVIVTLIGSLILGASAGYLFQRITPKIFLDVPTSVIAQFSMTFGLWVLAEVLGLSGILTIVAAAVTVARLGRLNVPAQMRVPTLAVWETAVFVLNAFAFVLIGMQVGPIWERLEPESRGQNLLVAISVLVCIIVVRFVWVFAFGLTMRLLKLDPSKRGVAFAQTLKGSLVLSWAGMRGIVTLAAAFAVPLVLGDGTPFPHRDLILLCAFTTVLGTLVIQGLTLGPLILALKLPSDDPVGEEAAWARAEVYRAGLAAIANDETPEAEQMRREYGRRIAADTRPTSASGRSGEHALRRAVLSAARARSNQLRLEGRIGDEAFRILEEEFDWSELEASAIAEPGPARH